jgi:hypothetical protein
MARRPYYYKAQLLDAISLLESGRPQKALRVLQTTVDVLDGRKPQDEEDLFNMPILVRASR